MAGDVDVLVVGGGFFGLYAARQLGRRGRQVMLVDAEGSPMQRASLVNQARLHQGYHYPRNLRTALACSQYFDQFVQEFSECVNDSFTKIYAIARDLSYTDPEQFVRFCGAAGIPCEPIPVDGLFNPTQVTAAFETREYAFDAEMLLHRLLGDLAELEERVELRFGVSLSDVTWEGDDKFCVRLSDGDNLRPARVINATYASINAVRGLFGMMPVPLKYELCEVVLCRVPDALRNVGITVMDGPFFSVMPFGKSGMHTLTAVTYTPHRTARGLLPAFPCQDTVAHCSPATLANCDGCVARPASAWPFMARLAHRYLTPDGELHYEKSLFGIKAVHQHAEVDDARPTLILWDDMDVPVLSVLSGKLNTVYDLDEALSSW